MGGNIRAGLRPAAPDIPSAPEAGFPGLDSSVRFGLFAPAKTPRTIIAKINREVVDSLNLPEAKAALLAQGAVAMPSTPEEFWGFVKREADKWAR
jgi:tripartite-type tricarboxylate transporter receptor subunit TctC